MAAQMAALKPQTNRSLKGKRVPELNQNADDISRPQGTSHPKATGKSCCARAAAARVCQAHARPGHAHTRAGGYLASPRTFLRPGADRTHRKALGRDVWVCQPKNTRTEITT